MRANRNALIRVLCDNITEAGGGACYDKAIQIKSQEGKLMSTVNIDRNNFSQEVMESDRPVLLDFWAPWCGPCRMVGPVVDEIARERADIKVGKVNVDEQPELAGQFGVMAIPTLVVMKDGKVADRAAGARPKAQILAML